MNRRILALVTAAAITGVGGYALLREPAGQTRAVTAAVTAQVPQIRPFALKRPVGAREIALQLRSDDPLVQEQAIVAAGDLGDPDVVRELAAIAVRGGKFANRAGNALGTVHAQVAVPVLVELTASESVLVRANAARALGSAGSSDEAGVLAGLVSDASQPLRVRQEAALSLATIGRPDDVPSLVDALGAPDEQLRISAVQALAQLDGAAARKALEQHGRGTLSATERVYVDRALAR